MEPTCQAKRNFRNITWHGPETLVRQEMEIREFTTIAIAPSNGDIIIFLRSNNSFVVKGVEGLLQETEHYLSSSMKFTCRQYSVIESKKQWRNYEYFNGGGRDSRRGKMYGWMDAWYIVLAKKTICWRCSLICRFRRRGGICLSIRCSPQTEQGYLHGEHSSRRVLTDSVPCVTCLTCLPVLRKPERKSQQGNRTRRHGRTLTKATAGSMMGERALLLEMC